MDFSSNRSYDRSHYSHDAFHCDERAERTRRSEDIPESRRSSDVNWEWRASPRQDGYDARLPRHFPALHVPTLHPYHHADSPVDQDRARYANSYASHHDRSEYAQADSDSRLSDRGQERDSVTPKPAPPAILFRCLDFSVKPAAPSQPVNAKPVSKPHRSKLEAAFQPKEPRGRNAKTAWFAQHAARNAQAQASGNVSPSSGSPLPSSPTSSSPLSSSPLSSSPVQSPKISVVTDQPVLPASSRSGSASSPKLLGPETELTRVPRPEPVRPHTHTGGRALSHAETGLSHDVTMTLEAPRFFEIARPNATKATGERKNSSEMTLSHELARSLELARARELTPSHEHMRALPRPHELTHSPFQPLRRQTDSIFHQADSPQPAPPAFGKPALGEPGASPHPMQSASISPSNMLKRHREEEVFRPAKRQTPTRPHSDAALTKSKESDGTGSEDEPKALSPTLDSDDDKYSSRARDLVHKVSEKNRRDRLCSWFGRLQALLFQTPLSDKAELQAKQRRKGRNGEIRREDVLEICESIIRKTSDRTNIANSIISKAAALGSINGPADLQWYSQSEIEVLCESMSTDLCSNMIGCDRPSYVFKRQLGVLNIVLGKSQAPHSKLFAYALACISYTYIDLQPNAALEAASLGWSTYSSLQSKLKKYTGERRAKCPLFQGYDLGALFLGHRALMLAALGKYRSATKAWSDFTSFIKETESETSSLTSQLPGALEFLFRAWQGESNTRVEYYGYVADAASKATNPYASKLLHPTKCGLGYVVATTFPTADFPASSDEGVELCEKFASESVRDGGEFSDLPWCNFIVRAYYYANMNEAGVRRANDSLSKIDAFGSYGAAYCDLLRTKGDCLFKLGAHRDAFHSYQCAHKESIRAGHVVNEIEAILGIARMCLSSHQRFLSLPEISALVEAALDRVPTDERVGPIMRDLAKVLKSLKSVDVGASS